MTNRDKMNFPPNSAAIALVNYEAMQDRAYDYVYQRDIKRDERRPLMWTVAFARKYNEWPKATPLKEAVMQANDCAHPKAQNDIRRAVDLGLLKTEVDGVNRFYFLPGAEQADAHSNGSTSKLGRLIDLLAKIREVVAIQLANPNDPEAGMDVFDGEEREKVYYNVIAL